MEATAAASIILPHERMQRECRHADSVDAAVLALRLLEERWLPKALLAAHMEDGIPQMEQPKNGLLPGPELQMRPVL
jgi:hypothetical protein